MYVPLVFLKALPLHQSLASPNSSQSSENLFNYLKWSRKKKRAVNSAEVRRIGFQGRVQKIFNSPKVCVF